MWRPDDWIETISFEEISKISPQLVSMMTAKERKIYEAGADAILKALKREGKYTDGTAPTLSIDVLPEQKGWLVFIPEEGGQ